MYQDGIFPDSDKGKQRPIVPTGTDDRFAPGAFTQRDPVEETRERFFKLLEQSSTPGFITAMSQAWNFLESKLETLPPTKITRHDGSHYLTHPVDVFETVLTEFGDDPDLGVAALLHDALEDMDVTFGEISDMFGDNVAEVVHAVTKSKNSTPSSELLSAARKSMEHRFTQTGCLNAIYIRLADRDRNSATLEHLPVEKQARKALEYGGDSLFFITMGEGLRDRSEIADRLIEIGKRIGKRCLQIIEAISLTDSTGAERTQLGFNFDQSSQLM